MLRKDIKVFGGFSATAPEANPSLRDTSATSLNKSILSGDFNGDDIALEQLNADNMASSGMLENAYHVVLAVDNVGNAQLNNFTIKGGFANEMGEGDYITVAGKRVLKATGGGMICMESNPSLSNLTFTHNIAFNGAGMFNFGAIPKISNTKIIGNISYMGGGMYNEFASPILTNVQITGNIGELGAGIYGDQGSPVLTNVTITGNSTGSQKSGMQNDDGYPMIRNSIIDAISNNESYPEISYSIVQGSGGSGTNWKPTAGYDRGNNLDVSPMFLQTSTSAAPFADGDYRLTANSPAVNAGSNTFYASGKTPDLSGITADLAGNLRFNGTVDMGAYEYHGTLPVNLIKFTAKAENAGARLQWQTASEVNNKYFTISRSTDGVNFTALGNINSKAINTSDANYSFLDQSPANGTNYYLLQQTDTDGGLNDLGIRTVLFQMEELALAVYPNPATAMANLKFAENKFNKAELIDVNGRVLERQLIKADQGGTSFNLSTYKPGTYIIRLKGAKSTAIGKIIKL